MSDSKMLRGEWILGLDLALVLSALGCRTSSPSGESTTSVDEAAATALEAAELRRWPTTVSASTARDPQECGQFRIAVSRGDLLTIDQDGTVKYTNNSLSTSRAISREKACIMAKAFDDVGFERMPSEITRTSSKCRGYVNDQDKLKISIDRRGAVKAVSLYTGCICDEVGQLKRLVNLIDAMARTWEWIDYQPYD